MNIGAYYQSVEVKTVGWKSVDISSLVKVVSSWQLSVVTQHDCTVHAAEVTVWSF